MTDTIRLATAADEPRVRAIVTAAYTPYIARIGQPPGPMLDDYAALIAARHVHVLTETAAIKAIIVLIPEPDTLLLDNVAVDPEFQRQGLGRRLMAFAEHQARSAGFAAIRLYTHQTMVENILLYQQIGYQETHRGTEHGLHRVYMTKRLAG